MSTYAFFLSNRRESLVRAFRKKTPLGHPAPEPIENVQVWEKRASSNLEIIGLFYLTVHFTDAPKDPRRSSVQK